MASRRFTVDPAKKMKFLNFILQMPKLRVPDAMKLAMFSDKDIADTSLRRFLQCALPGGTVKAMKAHLGDLLPPNPPPPDRHDRQQKRSVDDLLSMATEPAVNDLLSNKMDQLVAAATKPATRGRPAAMATPSQLLAKKHKQIINRLYYSTKKAHASRPFAKTATPHPDVTPPPPPSTMIS
jgi:hypothetical protein